MFIDGSHQYEYCKNDTEKAFEMLSPQGVVLWHDYGKLRHWIGVARHLGDVAAGGKTLYWLNNCTNDSQVSLVAYFSGVGPDADE